MRKLLPLALLLTVLLACERESRELAGRKGPVGSPVYGVSLKESIGPSSGKIDAVFPTAELDGKALFVKNCAACHQTTGQGVPGAFPPLDASAYVNSDNTARMAAIMIYGLIGPITVNGVQFNSAMAPLGGTLGDAELAATATYVRGAWSNRSSPVASEVFAAARQKWGTRGPFQISELGEEKK